MTEAFNSFFVNIGPKLADKIDIINKTRPTLERR